MRKFYGILVIFLSLILCSCAGFGIHYDAQTGNVAGIEKALENGVSIESRTENYGNTPLIVAAYSGKAEAVEYLCKKGADVNAQDINGTTALIHAAYYNHFDVIKILLKYNADKTIKDKYGNTALDYAEQYGYTQMISLLKNVNQPEQLPQKTHTTKPSCTAEQILKMKEMGMSDSQIKAACE